LAASDQTEHFVQQLAENQNRIYGYVYSLLADHSRAADVVQETNLVLWRKIDEFKPGKPFLPWAFAIARFQVLANIRDKKRDRVLLDSELADKVAEEVSQQAGQFDELRIALRSCLQSLTPANRDLVHRRYMQAMSIADVSTAVDRTAGSIKVALLRVRRQLAECVERRLAEPTS
jgi:RNA polymerase sigma-70 factor (ECF subfamily)